MVEVTYFFRFGGVTIRSGFCDADDGCTTNSRSNSVKGVCGNRG